MLSAVSDPGSLETRLVVNVATVVPCDAFIAPASAVSSGNDSSLPVAWSVTYSVRPTTAAPTGFDNPLTTSVSVAAPAALTTTAPMRPLVDVGPGLGGVTNQLSINSPAPL